jgi:hypothetical protein
MRVTPTAEAQPRFSTVATVSRLRSRDQHPAASGRPPLGPGRRPRQEKRLLHDSLPVLGIRRPLGVQQQHRRVAIHTQQLTRRVELILTTQRH